MTGRGKGGKGLGKEEPGGTGRFFVTTFKESPNLPSDVWPDVEE